jgi:hypothetical protein
MLVFVEMVLVVTAMVVQTKEKTNVMAFGKAWVRHVATILFVKMMNSVLAV